MSENNVLPVTSIPGQLQIEGVNQAVTSAGRMSIRMPTLEILPQEALVTNITGSEGTSLNLASGQAQRGQLKWMENEPFMRNDEGDGADDEAVMHVVNILMYHFRSQQSLDRKRQNDPDEIERVTNWSGEIPDRDLNTRQRRLWETIIEGDTDRFGLAHDGQPFFDTSHPGQNAQKQAITMPNLFGGDLALNETNFQTVITAMSQYFNSKGTRRFAPWRGSSQTPQSDVNTIPTRAAQWHVLCGEQNRSAAHELFTVGGTTDHKIYRGVASYDIVPEITELPGTENLAWWVLRRSDETPLSFVDTPIRIDNAVLDVDRDRIKWIVRKAWTIAYRFWWLMSKVSHS